MNTILLALCLMADPSPLSVDSARADKGTVKAGPALRHTFILKHTGNTGTLVITGVEPGCGCLKQTVTKLAMQPGEASDLALDINTLTQAEGPNVWHTTVHTRLDTPGQPPQSGKLALSVAAKLEREIVVTPPMIALSTTGEAKQTVTVVDKRQGGSLRVSQAVTTSEFLIAAIQPDGSILLSLAESAPADGKTYSETLTLITPDKDYPEFRIPVTIVKRTAATVTAAPERFSVRFASGESKKSAVVQLRDPAGKAITLASATCTTPGVTLTFSPGSNPVAAVKATVDTATAGKSGTAEVVVTFSTPAGQSLTIPLSWAGTN